MSRLGATSSVHNDLIGLRIMTWQIHVKLLVRMMHRWPLAIVHLSPLLYFISHITISPTALINFSFYFQLILSFILMPHQPHALNRCPYTKLLSSLWKPNLICLCSEFDLPSDGSVLELRDWAKNHLTQNAEVCTTTQSSDCSTWAFAELLNKPLHSHLCFGLTLQLEPYLLHLPLGPGMVLSPWTSTHLFLFPAINSLLINHLICQTIFLLHLFINISSLNLSMNLISSLIIFQPLPHSTIPLWNLHTLYPIPVRNVSLLPHIPLPQIFCYWV